MTSTRPGELRGFGLQPQRSNPRSRTLFWAVGMRSTWFLKFGGQAKGKLVSVVDSWPSLVVFGVVIPLWVKKQEQNDDSCLFFFFFWDCRVADHLIWLRETWRSVFKFNWLEIYHHFSIREEKRNFHLQYLWCHGEKKKEKEKKKRLSIARTKIDHERCRLLPPGYSGIGLFCISTFFFNCYA